MLVISLISIFKHYNQNVRLSLVLYTVAEHDLSGFDKDFFCFSFNNTSSINRCREFQKLFFSVREFMLAKFGNSQENMYNFDNVYIISIANKEEILPYVTKLFPLSARGCEYSDRYKKHLISAIVRIIAKKETRKSYEFLFEKFKQAYEYS